MGAGQPYMYDAPKYDSTFNPKRITQASFEAPAPRPRKQEGPLLDFNRHPDSYLIVPYGQTNVKPVNPKLKDRIKWVRWIQLGFRITQMLAAVGMLICVICVRGTADTEGWIIRLPPGVDIFSTCYAIYHLFRPAKGRTPSSSASYHFFAFIVDAGLIPFYVFTGMMGKNNSDEAPGTEGRWRSFFKDDESTNKLLMSTWLIAITCGGLHLISLFMDLYLVLVFRSIAKLPPDMNPLEDNLTRRSSTRSKHKHKSSSLSGITMDEKHASVMSASTNSSRDRDSKDPLIHDSRPISFFHSRKDSDMSFSAHTPNSARYSRDIQAEPAVYRNSMRGSQMDMTSRRNTHTNQTQRNTFASHKSPPNLTFASTRPDSFMESNPSTVGSDRDNYAERHSELVQDNWFVHPEPKSATIENDDDQDYDPYGEAYNQLAGTQRRRQKHQSYASLPQYSLEEDSPLQTTRLREGPAQQPLRMNPPTPPPAAGQAYKAEISRAHTSASTMTAASSIYSRPAEEATPEFNRGGTPRRKQYGDLGSATKGIRGSPRPQTYYAGQQAEESQQKYARPGTSHTSVHAGINPYGYGYEGSPRVVSRSGVEVGDWNSLLGPGADIGMRGREVSGKIAEEGQGGMWVMRSRKVSGMA